MGGVVGRVSNSIAGASFTLNGVTYNVSGSTAGWDKVLLLSVEYATATVMALKRDGHVFIILPPLNEKVMFLPVTVCP